MLNDSERDGELMPMEEEMEFLKDFKVESQSFVKGDVIFDNAQEIFKASFYSSRISLKKKSQKNFTKSAIHCDKIESNFGVTYIVISFHVFDPRQIWNKMLHLLNEKLCRNCQSKTTKKRKSKEIPA